MKNLYYFVAFSLLFCFASMSLISQELRVITESFKIPKDSCQVYAYEMDAFLRSKGLYQELPIPGDKKSDQAELVKKKLQIAGIDFTKDHTFILELKRTYSPKECEYLGFSSEECEYFGEFLIIEVGFPNQAKAIDVANRANEIAKKHSLNVPIYIPRFKCAQVGKNVLFVGSLHIKLDKYLSFVKDWQPGKE